MGALMNQSEVEQILAEVRAEARGIIRATEDWSPNDTKEMLIEAHTLLAELKGLRVRTERLST